MKKKIILLAAIAAVLLLAAACSDNIFVKTAEESFFAMNTVCSSKVSGKNSEKVSAEIQSIVKKLDEEVLSRQNKNSAISKLNENRGGEIDGKLNEYFSVLLDVCKKSGGKFDFTLGAVSDLWEFGGEPSVPDAKELSGLLSHTGGEKFVLSENSVAFEDAFTVDFGAAGKGIALDEIRDCLETTETKEAVISIGGSILLYGEKEFTVGIKDPDGNAGRYIAVLKVDEGCVSTSGSYERFFEENGKTYHHILDPDSGYPAESGIVSVTVVSESGILSDALSTACFVLGIEKGAALAAEYGCETVFVDENRKLYVSQGLKDKIEISDTSYSLAEQ